MFPDVSPDQTRDGSPPPHPSQPQDRQPGPAHPGQRPPGEQAGPNPYGNDPLGSYDTMPGGGQASGMSGFPWPFPPPPFFPSPFGSVSPQFFFTWPTELTLQIAIAGAVFWRQYFDALARFSQAREAFYRGMLDDLRRNAPDSGQNPGRSWGGMPNMPDMNEFLRRWAATSSAPSAQQPPPTPPPSV